MNPQVNAFFVGIALAQTLLEQGEKALTNALSEFGKFDAQQRQNFEQFMEDVMEQAQAAEAASSHNSALATTAADKTPDLQATIDELRAEIAEVRVQLQRYRANSH